MAHTPGPWTAYDAASVTLNDDPVTVPDHVRRQFVRDDGARVTQFIADCNTAMPESAANARLIAAAPELLAELKKAAAIIHAEWCFSDDNHGRACDEAHAAIAKAESR